MSLVLKSKKCDQMGVAPLKHEGIIYSDNKTKAEILNKQFSSVFTVEPDGDLPDLGPSPHSPVSHIQVQEKGVYKLLNRLKPNKASGPDGISTRFLKETASYIAKPLTVFFQATLNQGIVPDDWKSASVAPIFKKGTGSNPANYRPISLTSVCCKIIEHIIHSHIMDHLSRLNLLTDCQQGFRKNRSCETQLIITVDDLAKNLDANEQVDVILLDFSKACDKACDFCKNYSFTVSVAHSSVGSRTS